MLLESSHNKLKIVYMDRRPNKRLDDLIKLLLKIEEDDYRRHKRDNIYLGTISLPKKFLKCHEKRMLISGDCVLKCSSNQYTMKSRSKDLTYKVDILQDTCKEILCSHLFINPACVVYIIIILKEIPIGAKKKKSISFRMHETHFRYEQVA